MNEHFAHELSIHEMVKSKIEKETSDDLNQLNPIIYEHDLRNRKKQKVDWHMDLEYMIHPIFDPCTMVLRMNATNGIYTTGTETPKGIVLLTQLWMIRNYGYPIIILQHLQWNNLVLKKIWHQYSILSQ